MVNSNKILSLCGTSTQKDNYTINYKFGLKKHIELIYPQEKNTNNQLIKYVSYHRYQTEYNRIFFKNGGYLYTIYTDYDGEVSSRYEAGIMIKNISTDKTIDLKCTVIYKNEMNEIFNFIPKAEAEDFDL